MKALSSKVRVPIQIVKFLHYICRQIIDKILYEDKILYKVFGIVWI